MFWASVPAKSSYSKSRALFKVAVLYDWEIPIEKEKIVGINRENITKFFIEDSKTFTVKFLAYSVKEFTPSQVNVFFCEKIANSDISAIALHTKDINLTRYLAYLSSYFWIPCIGSTTDDQLLSQKVPFNYIIWLGGFYLLNSILVALQRLDSPPAFEEHPTVLNK